MAMQFGGKFYFLAKRILVQDEKDNFFLQENIFHFIAFVSWVATLIYVTDNSFCLGLFFVF